MIVASMLCSAKETDIFCLSGISLSSLSYIGGKTTRDVKVRIFILCMKFSDKKYVWISNGHLLLKSHINKSFWVI